MPTREKLFRNLVDPEKPRGLRRRQILKYIVENPGASQFEIARGVYGNERAAHSYKSLRLHLRRFEKLGIISITRGRPCKVSLTDEGLRLCKINEIEILSKTAKEFARILDSWKILANKLTTNEENQLLGLLSAQVLVCLFTISSSLPLPVPDDFKEKYLNLKPKPTIDVWGCLKGLWVYEMELREPPRLISIPFSRAAKRAACSYYPPGVALVRAHNLTQKFQDLSILFAELALKNPRLAYLRDHVKAAYSDHRAPHSREEKVKEKEGGEK
jgi:hypothetical protein